MSTARYTPAPGVTYLDTATYGLPPDTALAAIHRALAAWADGTGRWIDDWDREGDACRQLAARLLHASPEDVALLPAVSVASALAATLVPDGGEVLVVEDDFASVTWPLLALGERRGLVVRRAAFSALADAVTPSTCLVAASHVHSVTGAVLDTVAVAAAAHRAGAAFYLDASQSLGVIPCPVETVGADLVACAAYKWLCCPRGVAFLHVAPRMRERVVPLAASWRAAADPYGSFHDPELSLAPTAARFDVSLAWHAWVGARPALEALLAIDDQERFERAHSVSCHLADLLEVPRPVGPILSVPVRPTAMDALRDARIRVAVRGGRVRISPHFYNTRADAERAAAILDRHLVREGART